MIDLLEREETRKEQIETKQTLAIMNNENSKEEATEIQEAVPVKVETEEEIFDREVLRKMKAGLTREKAEVSVKKEWVKRARSKKPTEILKEKAPRFLPAYAWAVGIKFEDSPEEMREKLEAGMRRRKR